MLNRSIFAIQEEKVVDNIVVEFLQAERTEN